MSNILTAKDIYKSYGKHHVLKGLTLQVKRGEIHTILGANGAGKTTFIKIISTLLSKDSGEIQINGFNMDDDRVEIKRCIGYVGQDTERSAYARLSVKDNLLYFGGMQGLSRKVVKQRIDGFCEHFDIGKLLHKPFMTLSGGQKQMVIITRALLHDPDFVILDEPTKGLDPIVAGRMREFLKGYVKEHQKTVLLTSHILSEVEYLSDRVTLIDDGRVLMQGTPYELKQGLAADVFFEVDLEATDTGVIKELDDMLDDAVTYNNKYRAYPLKDMGEDSVKIFETIKRYDNKAVFNYKHATLEDVFIHNLGHFEEKFE